MHGGGRGRVSSLFLWRSTSGGDLWHREGVRPSLPDGSAEAQPWVFAPVQANSLTGSFGNFGWGMGEGDGTGERLCSPRSCALSSGAQQLSLPLFSSPPILQAELLAYNLTDVMSHLLSEHTPSCPSAFARQTRELCLAGWAGCPFTTLAPSTSLCSAHCLSALPTLVCVPCVYAWLRRVHSASLLVVFWVI